MPKIHDNRMGWIRNIDVLRNEETESYYAEYELASEVYIQGLLDYMNGMILCGPMTIEKDQRGLYKYLMKIKFAHPEAIYDYKKATAKGYLFKEGIAGELIALISLYFQCGLYLLAAFSGELNPEGLKIKLEYDPLYKPCFPNFDPTKFPDGKRDFGVGLPEFLESISKIPEEYHQQLILASHHYSLALREFGIDEEMVFIRLVSSVEALTKWVLLNKTEDLFSGKDFHEIIKSDSLSDEETLELRKIFEVRKSKLKFKRFINYYSKGFFKGGNYKAPHTRIKKKDLNRTMDAIYDSRSDYLHRGETMYLSRPVRGGQTWDTDPTVGMIIDKRRFPRNKKLPYGAFFQRLVRHCILGFIKEISC